MHYIWGCYPNTSHSIAEDMETQKPKLLAQSQHSWGGRVQGTALLYEKGVRGIRDLSY